MSPQEQRDLKLRPMVVIFEPGSGFKAVDAPLESSKTEVDRAQALLNFSKSFKKIKRAKSAAANRKRRRKRARKLRKCRSFPIIRPPIAELIYTFVFDSEPNDTDKGLLDVEEDVRRTRSSSLVPFPDKANKKLPDKNQLIQDVRKVALRSFYCKKVWHLNLLSVPL